MLYQLSYLGDFPLASTPGLDSHASLSNFSKGVKVEESARSQGDARASTSGDRVKQPRRAALFCVQIGRPWNGFGFGERAPDPAADPALPVWLVTLDGGWLDEFQRPTDSPTPWPDRHTATILDAQTGPEIKSSARP